MFDHVTIRAADQPASEAFYTTVLEALGIELTARGDWGLEWDDFSVAPAEAAKPPTRGLHVAFAAPTREHVDAFWHAGRAAGHPDAGAPGERPVYREDYYGAFLLDPDGNSAEAVHHGALRQDGHIDHLWIRVRDLARSRAFYELIAPHAGLRVGTDTAERVSFRGRGEASGSFSLLAGPPTAHVHLAFGASQDATVEAFHRAAVGAGHPDNGAPGERPVYHPGYYAAFVCDPDGHNVEVVNHHRA